MICSFCFSLNESPILCPPIHSIKYDTSHVSFILEGLHHSVKVCKIYTSGNILPHINDGMHLCYKCEDKIRESGYIQIKRTYLCVLTNSPSGLILYPANIECYNEIPCFNCNTKFPRVAGEDIKSSCGMYSFPSIKDGRLIAIYFGMWLKYESFDYYEAIHSTGKNDNFVDQIMSNINQEQLFVMIALGS